MTSLSSSQTPGAEAPITPTSPTKKFISVKYVAPGESDTDIPVSSKTEKLPDGTIIVTNVSHLPDGRTETVTRKSVIEETDTGTRTITTVTKRITISKDIYDLQNGAPPTGQTGIPPKRTDPHDVRTLPPHLNGQPQKPPQQKPPEVKPPQQKPSEVKPPQHNLPEIKPPQQKPPEVKPPQQKSPKPPVQKVDESPSSSSLQKPEPVEPPASSDVTLRTKSTNAERYKRFSNKPIAEPNYDRERFHDFFGTTYVNESKPFDEQLAMYRKKNDDARKLREHEAHEREKENNGDTSRKRERALGGVPPWKTISTESGSFEETSAPRWYNRAEEILKADIGPAEFSKRLDKQNKLFEEGCKKGGVFDGPSMYFSKGSVKSIFEKKTKQSHSRATHSVGIGALGYAVIDSDERLPPNGFFTPERVFEIRARHSNFPSAADDSKMGNRSMALKFADHDYDAPLDFVFQTGYLSPYFNLDSIEAFHNSLMKGSEAAKAYFSSLPIYLEAALEGLRHLPDSYYHQHYHSQMVYDFKANDGVKRLARFRIIPMDGKPESGRLDPEMQREAWYHLLLERPDSPEPPTYLRDEFRKRLNKDNLEYKLQVQLHEWTPEDTHILYNASLPWDSHDHPWINVATLCLTGVLPDDVTEVTRFNIGQHPKDVITYPHATSNADFNVVPNLRAEIYGQVARLRPQQVEEPGPGETVEYLIHTVTGSHQLAGNMDQNCNIYVSIIGTEGRTSFLKLQRRVKSDFDKGTKTTFAVHGHRVGEFQCAKVFKERKGSKSDWLLEYMVITTPYNNKCHTMPCYRWLTDAVPLLTLREGVGVIDNLEEDHYLRLLRSQEVTNRQRLFQWRETDADEDFAGLPGYCFAGENIHKLPTDMISEDMKKLSSEWDKQVTGKNSMIKSFMSLFKSKKSGMTEEYEAAVAEAIGKKEEGYTNLKYLLGNWRADEDFARQLVNGVNPNRIRRLKSLPGNFQLKDSMVRGQLEDGCTINTELQNGRLFIIEYPELEKFVDRRVEDDSGTVEEPDGYARSFDIMQPSVNDEEFDENMDVKERKRIADAKKKEEEKKRKEEEKMKKEKEKANKKMHLSERRKYLCAPMVIFHLKGNKLLPLAIQLTTDPTPGEDVIFTKKDDTNKFSDWLVAKMWVKVADANYHHVVTHILETHLLMEPVAIAAARQLPSVHPVFKLLYPHLRKLVSVNTIYRKRVLQRNGALAEVLGLGSQAKNNHIELMKDVMEGFTFNSLNLPDNLKARDVLDDTILPGYYYRDDALSLWEALRDYVTEVLSIYYEADDDVYKDDELVEMITDLKENGYHGKVEMPERFINVEELVKFCTIIIFQCSVQHAAVSRGMLDVYGYCPNAPPCMMKPYPGSKRGDMGYSEGEVLEMLPPPDIAERYIGFVLLMFGGLQPPKVPLGVFVEQLFTEERALDARKHLDERLQIIGKRIARRNESNPIPYHYLQPKNISACISD